MRRLKRTLFGLAILLGMGEVASCGTSGRLSNIFSDQIRQEMSVKQACSLYASGSGTSVEMPSGFLGTDPASLKRLKASLQGFSSAKGKGPPWARLVVNLQKFSEEFRDLPVREYAELLSAEQSNAIKIAHRKIEAMAAHAKEADLFWRDEASPLIDSFIDDIDASGALSAINDCARYRLTRDSQKGTCSWDGALRFSGLVKAYGVKFGTLASRAREQVDNLVSDIQQMGVILQRTDKLLGNITRSSAMVISDGESDSPSFPAIMRKGNFVLAEMTALGGVLRDGERIVDLISVLGETNIGDVGRLRAVGRLIISANSDSVVDAILFWVGRAIQRLEDEVKKLDEVSYGAVGIVTGIATRTKVVDRGLCTLTGELKRHLISAGLDANAFASRTCYAATTGRDSYPDSILMTKILYAMVYAGHGVGCSKEDKATIAQESSTDENSGNLRLLAPDPVPADLPLFDGIGADSEALVNSNWDARLTLARTRLSSVRDLASINRRDLPTLHELPPMLTASYLLTERRSKELLDAVSEKKNGGSDFGARHDLLEDWSLDLSGPYAEIPIQQICGRRMAAWRAGGAALPVSLPYYCHDAFPDGGGLDLGGISNELASVSAIMCEDDLRQRRHESASGFCSMLHMAHVGTDPECRPSALGATVNIRANYRDMELLSFGRSSNVSADQLNLIGRQLDTVSKEASKGRENVSLRVVGRASKVLPDSAEARDLLLALRERDLEDTPSQEERWNEVEAKMNLNNNGRRKDKKRIKLFKDAAKSIELLVERSGIELDGRDIKESTLWVEKIEDLASVHKTPEKVANHMLAIMRGLEALAEVEYEAKGLCARINCVVDHDVQPDRASDASIPKWRSITALIRIDPESFSCDRYQD